MFLIGKLQVLDISLLLVIMTFMDYLKVEQEMLLLEKRILSVLAVIIVL